MPMRTHIAPECYVAQRSKRFVEQYPFIILETVNLKVKHVTFLTEQFWVAMANKVESLYPPYLLR